MIDTIEQNKAAETRVIVRDTVHSAVFLCASRGEA